MSENDYFSAECHIIDTVHIYIQQFKVYALSVMRYGTISQANEAKKILKTVNKYQKEIFPRVLGGVPVPEEKVKEIRKKIMSINKEISSKKLKLSAKYITTDRFWKWFLGK